MAGITIIDVGRGTMENRDDLIKSGRARLTFALVTLMVFIGVLIFIATARPAWTAPGVANADGVSYRVGGIR